MKSFGPSVAFVVAALSGGVAALPTGDAALARRAGDFFFPLYWPQAAAANGPISVSGANGGFNYGGNGANGGTISVGRREEAEEQSKSFFFPLFWPSATQAANGAITASGANGGTNINGNGANGGTIAIHRREEAEKESKGFFFPIFWPSATQAVNGAITASGANGGVNINGNGANGGTIAIHRREEAEEDSKGLFFPFFNTFSQAANGPITASGANGGTNINGNGANGGKISINRRAEDFLFPFFWNAPAAPANGAISVNGANGGFNYGGSGANGGSISVN